MTIAAGSSKYLAITVTNSEMLKLKYAIYYSSNNDLSNVNIGYLENSESPGSGLIDANQNYIVTCKVTNVSEADITINFGMKYGFENGGDIKLENNQTLLEPYKIAYLIEAKAGDYITYLGRNGCDFSSGSCGGLNANYTSSSSLGYCANSSRTYNSLGWRVAYVGTDNVNLVSAGSPECMCTLANGTPSTSCADGDSSFNPHASNLNDKALTYCNSEYAYNNICNSSTSWNFGIDDFNSINSNNLSTFASCYGASSSECGLGNSLIDVGGHYWSTFDASELLVNSYFAWAGGDRKWNYSYPHNANGIRPVLKLSNDIMIVDGEGTEELPYRIATNTTLITDLSGNENHGVNQDAGWDKLNGTMITDGTTNYVDVGLVNYDFGSDITMITRVKFNSLDNSLEEQAIFTNFEASGVGFNILKGSLCFNIHTNGAYSDYCSTVTATEDTWYTLVGTYDGTNIKFYINGTEATLDTSLDTTITGATVTNSASGTITPSSFSFYIGGNPTFGGAITHTDKYAGTNMVIDDALIFDRAITPSEVTANYSGEVTVTDTTELLVYYDFEHAEEIQVAKSETDGVTTYYTSLASALTAASTTSTTTITLLEDTVEIIDVSNALKDTMIDLNNHKLTGGIVISNTDSNITLKNGKIASDGTQSAVLNYGGSVTIESGTYVNHTFEAHVIHNTTNGTMTIEDGIFELIYKNSGATTIYNSTDSTLTMNGGTVSATGYGIVNHAGSATIKNVTVTSQNKTALLNRESGTSNVVNSSLTGDYGIRNEAGTVIVRLSSIPSKIGGIIYRLNQVSDTIFGWGIYGQTDAACATWTAKEVDGNAQDDIIWTTAASYTDTYNTYLYCQIDKEDHNNESGTYATHIYNAAKTSFYYGTTWQMP